MDTLPPPINENNPLIKSQVILHRPQPHDGPQRTSIFGRAIFWNFDEQERNIPHTLHMPDTDWEEMGCPETITITIEPGDKLNIEPTVAPTEFADPCL
jgi:hypothetical protein